MRVRRRVLTILATAAVVLVAGPAAATADLPDTHITFDGFSDRHQILLDQYEPQGVYFLPDASTPGPFGPEPRRFEFCNDPPRLTPDQGPFDDAAQVTNCGNEFDNQGVLGVFTTYRSRVELDVGHNSTCSCQVQVDLTAWRSDRSKVMTSSATLPAAPGANTHLVVTSGAQDIAFFSVRSDLIADGPRFQFDDLIYDNPTTPPPADFVFGLSGSGGVIARQGATRAFPLTLLRFNGSSGPVNMSVSGLPAGISASSFSPNPATGRSTTLSLTAGTTATPTGPSPPPATVTATPGGAGAGATPRSVQVPVAIVAAFELNTPASLDAPACTPTTVGFPRFGVTAQPDFTDPIDVGVESGISTVGATIAPPTYNPGFADSNPRLTVTMPTDGDARRFLYLSAHSGPYSTTTYGITVNRTLGQIGARQVFGGSADQASAPQLLQSGDKIVLLGEGFCPRDTQVQFGNDKAKVDPEELNTTPTYYSDVPGGPWQRISVHVPRLASSGPIKVITPAGTITGRDLNIRSYRNTNGFSFGNYGKKAGKGWYPSFDDMQGLFGYDQTHVTVDPCSALTLGLTNCSAATLPIPDPGALVFLDSVKDAANKGDGAHCYGLSLSTLWLTHGRANLAAYTPGAKTVNALAGPSGPTPGLSHLIDLLHLAQFSSEAKLYQVEHGNENEGASGLHEQIRRLLAKGDPPMIIIHDKGAGHAVVAYDLEDLGGGAYYIYLWDPNDPAPNTAAAPDPEQSRIKITPDNRWSFKSLGWGGDLSTLYAMPWDVIPRQPGLPGSIGEAIVLSATADLVQVTDQQGRTLLDAAGEERSGKGSIPGGTRFDILDSTASNPSYQVPLDGSYTAEIKPSGSYDANFGGKSVSAKVEGAGGGAATAARRGNDKIAIDTKHGRLRFTPGTATVSLTTTLLAKAPDGSQRSVTVRAARSAGESLAFDSSRNSVTYRHGGAATTVTFDLGYSDTGALPATSTTKGIAVRNGDVLVLRPARWRALGSSRIALTITRGGHSSHATLGNRVRGARQLRLGALTDSAAPAKKRRLAIALTIARKPPADTQASVVWVVSKGRKVVARKVQNLTAAQLRKGKHTYRFDVKLKAGTYRYSAAAFAFTRGLGVTVNAAVARGSRSLRVR